MVFNKDYINEDVVNTWADAPLKRKRQLLSLVVRTTVPAPALFLFPCRASKYQDTSQSWVKVDGSFALSLSKKE